MTIRAPHLSKKLPREVQPPQFVPNLLVTTLLAVAPFVQHDWPNPQPFVKQQLTLQENISTPIREEILEDLLVSVDWTYKFIPWPQQRFTYGSPTALIQLEPIAGDPFFQTEWPQPEPLPTQQPPQFGTLLPLIFAEPEPPFFELKWPDPESFKRQTPFQVGTLLPLIFAEPEPPFQEIKWPTPPAKPTQTPFQVGTLLPLIDKPFNQNEWPNPTLNFILVPSPESGQTA